MDSNNKIKSVVLNQLTGVNGLYSLKLQNHIYGCFIIMEDIAQGVVDVSGNVISTPKFSFDLDEKFGDIGIRYGFAMDSKLAVEEFNTEYKTGWLELFRNIDLQRDIGEVDKIEDCLIPVIQTAVKAEEAFFFNALETGSLPQEWIELAFTLLNPTTASVEKDEPIENKNITRAITEKPLNARKKFAKTRSVKIKINTLNKRGLKNTRRNI